MLLRSVGLRNEFLRFVDVQVVGRCKTLLACLIGSDGQIEGKGQRDGTIECGLFFVELEKSRFMVRSLHPTIPSSPQLVATSPLCEPGRRCGRHPPPG